MAAWFGMRAQTSERRYKQATTNSGLMLPLATAETTPKAPDIAAASAADLACGPTVR